MDNDDATEFLHKLAQPPEANAKEPRVVLVRSDQRTKTFIASALSTLDRIGQHLADQELANPSLKAIEDDLLDLERKSAEQGLTSLVSAIQLAGTLAALSRHGGTPRSAEDLTVVFRQIFKSLAAMLLRVYIEGRDQNCARELSTVRSIVYSATPTIASIVETTQKLEH